MVVVDPLDFLMVPDFHGGGCAIRFDIGPAMRAISPEDFEAELLGYYRDVRSSNQPEYFLDMISTGSTWRDGIREYCEDPPDTPHTGGTCEICGESWYADEGYEIVASDGHDDVYMWFDRNRPDLVARGLISSEHGPGRCTCCRIPLETQTVINRHDA
jgi:hypothetical protein